MFQFYCYKLHSRLQSAGDDNIFQIPRHVLVVLVTTTFQQPRKECIAYCIEAMRWYGCDNCGTRWCMNTWPHNSAITCLVLLRGWYNIVVQAQLKHVLSFFAAVDYQAQRLWIRPTPTDPTTRFLDVMGGRTLPGGRYYVCVTMWLDSRVRVTNCDECGGWGPGWRSGRRYDDDADGDYVDYYADDYEYFS